MKTTETIEIMRKEAKSNPLFNAVCLVFSKRERARNQVTVSALIQRMTKAGWPISVAQAREVLKLLASADVGKLKYDAKNNVEAVVDIKLKLQGIGKAAISNEDVVQPFKQALKYASVALPKEKREPVIPAPSNKVAVAMSISIDGRSFVFPVTPNVSASQLGKLLVEVHKQLSELGA